MLVGQKNGRTAERCLVWISKYGLKPSNLVDCSPNRVTSWHWSAARSGTCCSIERAHDLDFCTSARPEQFEPILRRWGHDGFWDMGRKFGTLGAMRRRPDGTEVKVEVTTYRSDTYDPDSRKPEVNYGDTLEGDLSRRDFTVNAMALRVPDLQFVDPFGGASDLAKGVLRTPVDPRQSFDDDPLRMMRAVRFVAQLGLPHRAGRGRGDYLRCATASTSYPPSVCATN